MYINSFSDADTGKVEAWSLEEVAMVTGAKCNKSYVCVCSVGVRADWNDCVTNESSSNLCYLF